MLEIFNGIARHHLTDQRNIIQVFEPTLTPLQQQVLDLLGIPANRYYTSATPDDPTIVARQWHGTTVR